MNFTPNNIRTTTLNMVIRLIILALLFSACRSSDMACPDPQFVKLKKRPTNFLKSSRSLSASNRQLEKEKPKVEFRQLTRNVKSIDSIEEWDCPKPGSKTMPKSVKESIKKNRKKFEIYYKNRVIADSMQTRIP